MNPVPGIAPLAEQLADLKAATEQADSAFENACQPWSDGDTSTAEWLLEVAFRKLLVLTEYLQLPLLRAEIEMELASAKAGENGLGRPYVTEDGDLFSHWAGALRTHMRALAVLVAPPPESVVTRSVEAVLRSSVYPITNPQLFPSLPQREEDVHVRIEGILVCVFPDLKHKPALTKPIKNFIPDTGLPGARTLIEYKFVSSQADCSRVADELLADTRGYHSPDYDRYIYVIYETSRLRAESEWAGLLTQCGVPPNTSVIVLAGTAPKARVGKV